MELGALIANNKLDILIFFWDPLESQPHDVDVKAVLRLAVLYNVPTACNRATARHDNFQPNVQQAAIDDGKRNLAILCRGLYFLGVRIAVA